MKSLLVGAALFLVLAATQSGDEPLHLLAESYGAPLDRPWCRSPGFVSLAVWEATRERAYAAHVRVVRETGVWTAVDYLIAERAHGRWASRSCILGGNMTIMDFRALAAAHRFDWTCTPCGHKYTRQPPPGHRHSYRLADECSDSWWTRLYPCYECLDTTCYFTIDPL